MQTIIKIENLHRDFQVGSEVVRALKGISFEVAEGEFVSIMGTSGSGNTTRPFTTTVRRSTRRGVITRKKRRPTICRIWGISF